MRVRASGGVAVGGVPAEGPPVEVEGSLCQQTRLGVLVAVYAQVAPLARGYDVFGDGTGWVTVAEVGHGKGDSAVKPAGGLAVELHASARVWIWGVDRALAGAFALAAGALEADVGAERAPVRGVACPVNGHGYLSLSGEVQNRLSTLVAAEARAG